MRRVKYNGEKKKKKKKIYSAKDAKVSSRDETQQISFINVGHLHFRKTMTDINLI